MNTITLLLVIFSFIALGNASEGLITGLVKDLSRLEAEVEQMEVMMQKQLQGQEAKIQELQQRNIEADNNWLIFNCISWEDWRDQGIIKFDSSDVLHNAALAMANLPFEMPAHK